MAETNKPAPSSQPQKQQPEVKKADAPLDEKQLDKVSGGLSNACCTGKHIPTGTITV